MANSSSSYSKQAQLSIRPINRAEVTQEHENRPDPSLTILDQLSQEEEALPSYDDTRLPSYNMSQRQHMLQAEPGPTNNTVRLLLTRMQTVHTTVHLLDSEISHFHAQVEQDGRVYHRIAHIRRQLASMVEAATRRYRDAQRAENNLQVLFREQANGNPDTGLDPLLMRYIASRGHIISRIHIEAVNADDGVRKVDELRREFERLRNQENRRNLPSSRTGDFLGFLRLR